MTSDIMFSIKRISSLVSPLVIRQLSSPSARISTIRTNMFKYLTRPLIMKISAKMVNPIIISSRVTLPMSRIDRQFGLSIVGFPMEFPNMIRNYCAQSTAAISKTKILEKDNESMPRGKNLINKTENICKQLREFMEIVNETENIFKKLRKSLETEKDDELKSRRKELIDEIENIFKQIRPKVEFMKCHFHILISF